jgi:energy-coupling factor transporter ATP-binding protein EcfA2
MKKRTPFHMSGGERQLLALGIALIHSPKLFLLDEPFAGVDAKNSEILFQCLSELKNESITFVIVEHKMQLLKKIINKEIKLELGEIKK